MGLLSAHGVEAVADVRRFPGSRNHPHFSRERLSDFLTSAGLGYQHFPELGGRRRPRPDSPNTAWRSESFRGYADHTETEEFRSGVKRLLESAGGRRTAILCSEAVWWRCHRALIADFLKASGVEVEHILSAGKSVPHPYTSAARLVGGRLSYEEGAGGAAASRERPTEVESLKSRITAFRRDEEGHWVAELECGHRQHVRHDPPLVSREWVLTPAGRRSRIGAELNCKLCEEDAGATARPAGS